MLIPMLRDFIDSMQQKSLFSLSYCASRFLPQCWNRCRFFRL